MGRRAPVLAMALACAGALAQPVLTGRIDEEYATVGKHRGRSLVGVVQGALPARVDIRALTALVPEAPGAGSACLRLEVQSFDGHYYAVGELQAQPVASGPLPVRAPNFSRHADRLSLLAGRELAPLFRAGCRSDGDIVPASFGGDRGELWAALHLPAVRAADPGATAAHEPPPLQVSLELETGGAAVQGQCSALVAPARAYNLSCRFELPPALRAGGAARLKVRWRPTGAPLREERHRVWLAIAP